MNRNLPTIYQAPLAALNFSLSRAARARESIERCSLWAVADPDGGWSERVAAWQRSETFWRQAAARDLTLLR